MECQCEKCKSACMHRPGWFLPNEIEPAAKGLGLTIKEFFEKYLVVDYWCADPNIWILAPTTLNNTPGEIAGFNPKGHCIFFNEKGLCDIHSVNGIITKPRECSFADHLISNEEYEEKRNEIVEAWNNPEAQQMIVDLLGYQPIEPDINILDIMGLIL